MIQTSFLFAPLIGLVPMTVEHWALLIILVLATAGTSWYVQAQKIKELHQQEQNQKEKHAAEIKGLNAAAAAEAALASQKLDAAVIANKVLTERHETLYAASQRRETEAEQRIKELHQDLSRSREIAAQLEPTLARLTDLEKALISERGHVATLQLALEASNKRAEDFQTRLDQAVADLKQLRQRSDERESELVAKITKLEQTIQSNATLVETAETQVNQANETLSSYRQQAETRLTNLQRQLAAAEAKSALVQKEFMSAVGVLPEKPLASTRSASVVDDKRLLELEARILQIEAEARKKAREDGYKIAELEYRLSEAQEALVKSSEA